MKRVLTLFTIMLISSIACAQQEDFSIYVFKNRYNNQGKSYIDSNSKIKEIEIFGKNIIYPSGNDTINLKKIEKQLKITYPDRKSDGILCLNIENKIYQNLKNFEQNKNEFLIAEQKMIEMLNLVKELRPNLKIGIYGIPFRTYYQSQLIWNKNKKFDRLLSKTDILFPSLYILYPDKQNGEQANNDFWSQNLETSLDYGQRLNKRVLPFIWYVIHSSNKKYGGEILDKTAMKRYLSYIKNYKSKNNFSVKGVVWWDFSKSNFKKNIRFSDVQKKNSGILDKNTILKEYTNLID